MSVTRAHSSGAFSLTTAIGFADGNASLALLWPCVALMALKCIIGCLQTGILHGESTCGSDVSTRGTPLNEDHRAMRISKDATVQYARWW